MNKMAVKTDKALPKVPDEKLNIMSMKATEIRTIENVTSFFLLASKCGLNIDPNGIIITNEINAPYNKLSLSFVIKNITKNSKESPKDSPTNLADSFL